MLKIGLMKIFRRGCLRRFCFLMAGIAFWCSPVIAKFLADFIIYKTMGV